MHFEWGRLNSNVRPLMTVVMSYDFKGLYLGDTEYKGNHPEVGATHKCLLFLK